MLPCASRTACPDLMTVCSHLRTVCPDLSQLPSVCLSDGTRTGPPGTQRSPRARRCWSQCSRSAPSACATISWRMTSDTKPTLRMGSATWSWASGLSVGLPWSFETTSAITPKVSPVPLCFCILQRANRVRVACVHVWDCSEPHLALLVAKSCIEYFGPSFQQLPSVYNWFG